MSDATLAIIASAATHQGAVRTVNQDALVDRPDLGLWAVADGAGGHHAGEIASAAVAAALEAIPAGLTAAELLAVVRDALEAVHQELRAGAAAEPPRICASTVVVLMVRDGHFACLWAGDSRAYLWRDGALARVTRDHSLVEELVEQGVVASEDAERHPQANVITRAVGADVAMLDLEKRSGKLEAFDRLLLCSDGISKTLGDDALAHLLAAPGCGAASFIEAALAARVSDNVTAVTLRIDPPP